MQHATAHKVALKHILQMQVGTNKMERPHAHTKREREREEKLYLYSVNRARPARFPQQPRPSLMARGGGVFESS